VDRDGRLSNLQYVIEQGEVASAVDNQGNLYVADGHIYIYDPDGKKKGMISVPERPSAITFGGKDCKILFIAARSSLYAIRIE
jgi:sugar lactone lactonase YvrE